MAGLAAALADLNAAVTALQAKYGTPVVVMPHSSGWPDATSTGVPIGTNLRKSGLITVTVAGTVIDSVQCPGIVVKANNVTIRRSLIQGSGDGVALIDTGDTSNGIYTGILVEDCEFDGQNSGIQRGIGMQGFTLLRCNVHGVMQGVVMNKDIVVQDCWIHDPNYASTTHKEAVLSNGGNNFTITHNNLHYDQSSTVSAAVSLFGDFAAISNVTVTNNLLNGGGYEIYAGTEAGKAFPTASNVVVTGNTFGTKYGPLGGWAGFAADWAAGNGNSWSGNVTDTGAEVNP